MSGNALIAPGATIGILGGGQLGRMIALAAAELGYRSVVLTPEIDAPASQVASRTILADYGDEAALAKLAAAADVITLEFENVPAAAVDFLAATGKPVRPDARALALAQDRLLEKDFIRRSGGETAPYRAIGSTAELDRALASIGCPAVLKTRRFGYDGRGQALVRTPGEAQAAWAAIKGKPAILEGFVDFACEISVIAARSANGDVRTYVPVENRHRDHILAETVAPAAIASGLAAAAQSLAESIVAALDLVGLLAVEMFITKDGRILVNEIAPRPHNSGHWTIDACLTSQFEQLVRAICGLPLGSTERHSNAVMINLLGNDARAWQRHLAEPNARLHLYGKAEIRTGRKMGHVTRLSPRSG